MRVWTTETNEALKTLLDTPAAAVKSANQRNPEGDRSPDNANERPTIRYIRLTSTMRLTR